MRGRVKLLDFGLARVQDENDKQLTQEGLVMGTPAFMAPEQAMGRPVDPRCDLFSLGCILYRMATGRNAFQGANAFSLMLAVTTVEPPAPTALEPGTPPALADLIVRAARRASAPDSARRSRIGLRPSRRPGRRRRRSRPPGAHATRLARTEAMRLAAGGAGRSSPCSWASFFSAPSRLSPGGTPPSSRGGSPARPLRTAAPRRRRTRRATR